MAIVGKQQRAWGQAGTAPGRRSTRWVVTGTVALVLLVGVCALGQGLYYQEISKDGTIYVFNTAERFKAFQTKGELGKVITLAGRGPAGETVVAENETAIDLFVFKHGLPAYERPAAKPAAQPLPTALKVGDGEVRVGALIQAWYVMDSSPVASSTGFLGNTTGNNTFRLRRGELKVAGKITPSWGFELMADTAKNQVFTASGVSTTDDKILQDITVSFLGVKGHEFLIGQRKIMLSDEGLRPTAEVDFAERARVIRVFADRRETGLFYRGELSKRFSAFASVTNGTVSNVVDNSNDTVFAAGRLDFKPVSGLVVGVSGGYSGGEGAAHLTRKLVGVHTHFDGPEGLPIRFLIEYLGATDGQVGKADLRREGYSGSFLYTFAKLYQLGIRYDVYDRDTRVSGAKIKTWTAGMHYLVKGKNMNLKLDYFRVTEEGRKIGGKLAEDYNQGILAAQIAF